jgi:hypothetical protein
MTAIYAWGMLAHRKNPKTGFAKLIAAACVRRGYLEKLHSGATPVTRTGDYFDVDLVAAEMPAEVLYQGFPINHDLEKSTIGVLPPPEYLSSELAVSLVGDRDRKRVELLGGRTHRKSNATNLKENHLKSTKNALKSSGLAGPELP